MNHVEIEIGCPVCRHVFKERAKLVRAGRSRQCAVCRRDVFFTEDHERRAKQALDDLEESLRELGFR
jgi:hypothetical protein